MKGYLYTEKTKYWKFKKIVGTNYKIFICSKITFNKGDYQGFILYDTKEIFIRSKRLINVLNHEITHAIFNELYKKSKDIFLKKLRSNEQFIEIERKILF